MRLAIQKRPVGTDAAQTLALRIKPHGLWLVLTLSLFPSVWTLFGGAVRLGLNWLPHGLIG